MSDRSYYKGIDQDCEAWNDKFSVFGSGMYCYECEGELFEDSITGGECEYCGHEIIPEEIGV